MLKSIVNSFPQDRKMIRLLIIAGVPCQQFIILVILMMNTIV